jgi:hypothetical protein
MAARKTATVPKRGRPRKGSKVAKPYRKLPNQCARKATKQERIRVCVELMAGGEWVSGVTATELAELFGVTPLTLAEDAAEASRYIRQSIADTDELRAMLSATLQTITQRCMAKKELRTAVEAVRVLAGVSGAERPKKLEHSGDVASFLSLAFSDTVCREAGTDDEPDSTARDSGGGPPRGGERPD